MTYEEAFDLSVKYFVNRYYFKHHIRNFILYEDYKQECALDFYTNVKSGEYEPLRLLMLCKTRYKRVRTKMWNKDYKNTKLLIDTFKFDKPYTKQSYDYFWDDLGLNQKQLDILKKMYNGYTYKEIEGCSRYDVARIRKAVGDYFDIDKKFRGRATHKRSEQCKSKMRQTWHEKYGNIDFSKAQEKAKLVTIVCDLQGNEIVRFDSRKECAEWLGIGRPSISEAIAHNFICRGQYRIKSDSGNS